MVQPAQHHYIDDDSGPEARRPVWALGRAYVKKPTSNPHHYLDFPRFAKRSQHHYIDDDNYVSSRETTETATVASAAKAKHQSLRSLKRTHDMRGRSVRLAFGRPAVKGKFTTLSGLEGQPAAPFGGQTFGRPAEKGKLTKLSGLEGQPAAPFGGQTFGQTFGAPTLNY